MNPLKKAATAAAISLALLVGGAAGTTLGTPTAEAAYSCSSASVSYVTNIAYIYPKVTNNCSIGQTYWVSRACPGGRVAAGPDYFTAGQTRTIDWARLSLVDWVLGCRVYVS